ncbi:radical SAM protein [candidate division KSB1 bacterium]|nr:radical SAM protein [candidate division KSB1 bacterium]
MNFQFIIPCAKSEYYELDFHHGVAQLSACLKKNGHETGLLVLDRFDKRKINRAMAKSRPDILAYSFTSDNSRLAKWIMDYLSSSGIFSIAGGVHTSSAADDVIPHVDAICLGEGEGAIVDLAQGEPITQIKNLWIHRNGRVLKQEIRPLLQDLDELPFPDRELFDYQNALDQDHRADFMAGRGCPYRCTYCINECLMRLGTGKYVRWRTPENIISEIDCVLKTYTGIESICFQDDTFALDIAWLKPFALLYKQRIGLPFACNLRVEAVDEETIEVLKEAGCAEARVGVEQGNETLRRKVLRRKMSNNTIIRTFQQIKKAGIQVFAYNMVGIPGETASSIEETIALNREIKPDKLHVSMFRPYPGTKLYDICKEKGYLSREETPSYFEPISTLSLPTIKKEKVEYYFRIFRIAVLYPRLTPLAGMMAKVKISAKTTLYDVFFKSALTLFFFLRKRLPERIKKPLFRILKV